MSVEATLPPPKQARSIASRRKLLTATIDCLVELGHAGTTTTEVAKRADLSQGALYKHFPSKAALMGAAAEHLFAQLIEGYRYAFDGLAAEDIVDVERRLRRALDLLWALFHDAPLAAAIELYVAARTDRELAETLTPILARHTDNVRREAERLFPELASQPALPAILAGVMSAMQGAALIAPLTDGTLERAFIEQVTLTACLTALEQEAMP